MTDDGGDDSPNTSDQDRTAQEAPDLAPKAKVEAAKQENVVIEQAIVVANDSVVLEGFSTKDTTEKSSSEIVTKFWVRVALQHLLVKYRTPAMIASLLMVFKLFRICEEGEIEEDEETEEVEVADSASLNVGSLPVVVVTNEKTSVIVQRQGGSQRNKGRAKG
ncbi:hypothetical protein DY000_02009161 [Brassica cretica]|uniref:Uncharacterized protein n=1 Tax=Brassica cretica TaxID=69181 RepID=A0ABQ7C4Z5_BRACR|nr:hypothetical protein DY000_02009161 [Brassica cretica]